jgi:putative DNA methylase
MSDLSFIEVQFPVNKLSKESYKERKAGASQSLTGLGKWWGRKPLVIVRATILGLLMPASDDPKKDKEIFLKLLTMDEEGLWQRKRGNISASEVYEYATETEREFYFITKDNKLHWRKSASGEDREHMQHRAFNRMSYDIKLAHCVRPEEIDGPSKESWNEINLHLGTNASSLKELIHELGARRFGHVPKVGDAFCGGGSIPFEAAVIGCDVYGADLSPVGALLTWASLHIIGGGSEIAERIQKTQKTIYEDVQKQIKEWRIEQNEEGWIDATTGKTIGKGFLADYFLYCVEATDPVTGWKVPLAPSWVIGQKTKTIARLQADLSTKSFKIEIVQGATPEVMDQAKLEGTWDNGIRCPVNTDGLYLSLESRTPTPIEEIRGREGLRQWENEDIVPRRNDVFQERLYCIRWIDSKTGEKYYRAPTQKDIAKEKKVLDLLTERFSEWQEQSYIPNRKIKPGDKTEEPIRTRGWTHWHHLYNPRQLLTIGLFQEIIDQLQLSEIEQVAAMLGVGRLADWCSRLSRLDPSRDEGKQIFYNQAYNTLCNYATRTHLSLNSIWNFIPAGRKVSANSSICPLDARQTRFISDLWITDPPYADAVNYEELSELFLAWYGKRLMAFFPQWYSDSKRALAVKGTDENFRLTMVECYKRLAENMPDNGFQIVMFTHQDVNVWSDLSLILWAADLKVTAAWTIGTETETAFRTGKYVQGTVLLVLRKRKESLSGDMADIYPLVQDEVKKQLQSMLDIDDKEDPNFGDADYQLAAYAAALRIITAYSTIGGIDIERELRRIRKKDEESPLAGIIRSAVRIASDYLVPDGLDRSIWRRLGAEERFYIKGVEIEAHGEYRDGVYQEFARGFGVRDYHGLLGSDEANKTRLKTPSELKGRDLSGEGFAGSLLRQVLFAVYKTASEDGPRIGREYIRHEIPSYWENRTMILALLDYLSKKPSSTMIHWKKDADAAHLLYGAIAGDGI